MKVTLALNGLKYNIPIIVFFIHVTRLTCVNVKHHLNHLSEIQLDLFEICYNNLTICSPSRWFSRKSLKLFFNPSSPQVVFRLKNSSKR